MCSLYPPMTSCTGLGTFEDQLRGHEFPVEEVTGLDKRIQKIFLIIKKTEIAREGKWGGGDDDSKRKEKNTPLYLDPLESFLI